MGLHTLDGYGGTLRHMEGEAHHGFVDGTDLLHIQPAVGDALAVQDQEFLQHPVDHEIRDQGCMNAFALVTRAAQGTCFQEGEAVGIEEVAMPGR